MNERNAADIPPLSVQDYDVALKLLLQGPASTTMRELAGTAVAKWLNVELPKVQNLRLDLLGETVDGGLIHVELQSSNDAAMPLRMAEYCLGVFRLYGRFPRQVVLYVGEAQLTMQEAQLTMQKELRGADVLFQYRLIDIRTLNGDRLLESEDVGDNVIAILAGLRDHGSAVRKIVERIAGLAAAARETALAQLTILAGLRRLSKTVEQEARKMPIRINLLENEVLGPVIKKGLLEARQEGELTILRRQIEERFGVLPGWASDKLAALAAFELEDLSERVLDAVSLEELLK